MEEILEQGNVNEPSMEEIVEKSLKINSPKPEEYAAIYARKSTKLENNSLKSQASLARDEIKKRNLFVYDVYEDEESATKYHPMHRPGFKRLLYDAMNGKFKTLVVFRRDRLARKVEDLIDIKNFFKKHDIKIIYSNYGEYQVDENSYLSSFIENIIMSVDELEPSILSERIAIGKMQKRKKGIYFYKVPYGYKYISDDSSSEKLIVQEEENAKDIKYILENFLEKVNTKAEFSSFVKDINSNCKKKYTVDTVTDIILKPLYGGVMTRFPSTDVRKTLTKNDEKFIINEALYIDCTNLSEPIVKKNLWFQCVERWRLVTPEKNTVENKEEEFLFKGLLHCKTCDTHVYLLKDSNIYKCVNGCCQIEKSLLEDFLINKILNDLLSKQNLKLYQESMLKDTNNTISKYESTVNEIKLNQNEEMFKLIKSFTLKKGIDYSSISNLIFKEKNLEKDMITKKQNATRINIALAQLSEIYSTNTTYLLINKFKRSMGASQELLKSIIEKVVIKHNEKGKIDDNGNCRISYYE